MIHLTDIFCPIMSPDTIYFSELTFVELYKVGDREKAKWYFKKVFNRMLEIMQHINWSNK